MTGALAVQTAVAPSAPPSSQALEVKAVCKAFGQVQALDGVSLTVNHGEVVALVGDNGAGKSTLVKIISGVLPPDQGELFIHGQKVAINSPQDAVDRGIRTIFQDLALADNLDVSENLFLGREPTRGTGPWRRIDFGAMRRRTSSVLDELGIGTIPDVSAKVAQLSGGQRQTVAVARATLDNCAILLLDEPTASLGLREAHNVMQLVHRLCAQGTAIVVISHNMRQVFEVADRIVVLHIGKIGAVFNKAETTPETVVRAIMGRAS
jgi:ABC-type sugar transport system ATPase subunit